MEYRAILLDINCYKSMAIKEIQKKYNLTEEDAELIWRWWQENNPNSTKQGCLTILLFFTLMIPLTLLINNPFFQSMNLLVSLVIGIVVMIGGTCCVFMLIGKIMLPKMESQFWEYMKTHSPSDILKKTRDGL